MRYLTRYRVSQCHREANAGNCNTLLIFWTGNLPVTWRGLFTCGCLHFQQVFIIVYLCGLCRYRWLPLTKLNARNAGRRETRFGNVWIIATMIRRNAKHRETCLRKTVLHSGWVSHTELFHHEMAAETRILNLYFKVQIRLSITVSTVDSGRPVKSRIRLDTDAFEVSHALTPTVEISRICSRVFIITTVKILLFSDEGNQKLLAPYAFPGLLWHRNALAAGAPPWSLLTSLCWKVLNWIYPAFCGPCILY